MYKAEMHETGRNAWLRIEEDGVTVSYKRDGICDVKRTFDMPGQASYVFSNMANAMVFGKYCEEQRCGYIKTGKWEPIALCETDVIS